MILQLASHGGIAVRDSYSWFVSGVGGARTGVAIGAGSTSHATIPRGEPATEDAVDAVMTWYRNVP